MNSSPATDDALMKREIGEFTDVLQRQGVHAALRYLNNRTPHQYTGIFRFDGDMLRNVALFDRFQPALEKGGDAPMGETYCSLVGRQQAPLEIADATTDSRAKGIINTPVISYCGVLIRDTQGRAFGTLCHYDMQRCEERTTDMPLLLAAAGMLYQHLA
ncbi:hypothetical protein [Hymenobacter cellulosilyticus]|uniref:GAF domain-containing protein n=1 Tax=Hymenobacter cellulosilyticus TaxID=2932248 RepID=A0A8T9QAK6_9BACT|nr:hypothetical protein [Hymenobacter cellulosilyticus]UOQ74032.1 hypothetical protein MUN79_09135 [Hymenobacter cellulosilyticus]